MEKPLQNLFLTITAGLLVCAQCGCSTWPFAKKERTSIITPGMRMAAVREIGARAPKADMAEQQQICEQLARQIQTEPDPLVRMEIQNTVAAFKAPLAQKMLVAGLNDEDTEVRLTCCYRLAERAEQATIGPLRETMTSDTNLDVRLAAIDALAKMNSSDTISALGTALEDRDPAVQYAAVQALKSASGEDFGNDVSAWQQFVAGEVPSKPEISVAERVQQFSPF